MERQKYIFTSHVILFKIWYPDYPQCHSAMERGYRCLLSSVLSNSTPPDAHCCQTWGLLTRPTLELLDHDFTQLPLEPRKGSNYFFQIYVMLWWNTETVRTCETFPSPTIRSVLCKNKHKPLTSPWKKTLSLLPQLHSTATLNMHKSTESSYTCLHLFVGS